MEDIAACSEAVGAAAVGGRVEDVFPELVGAGEGLFVGGHDGDALVEEQGVGVGDILVGGVVYEDDFSGGLD